MGGSWGKERETVIYRWKWLLLEAHTQISTLKDEASELARYIKGKGKWLRFGIRKLQRVGGNSDFLLPKENFNRILPPT